MYEPEYLCIAKQMLSLDENTPLPKLLEERLEQIDVYCFAVDCGKLRSRQVIAMVIEQFRREFPNER